MLSTAPPVLGITKDNGKIKLGIYKVYDFTKGGADIICHKMEFYTLKPKSRRWKITVNSSTTFALQKNYDLCKQDSFEYCYILLYQLEKPFIQSRSLNGLTIHVRQKIELVIGKRE